MNTPLKVAVVGGGEFGTQHVNVYRSLPGVCLVGIVESNSLRYSQWASDPTRGSIQIYHSVSEMLAVAKLDAVSVVTPSTSHLQIATELLKAGVDILVEKPFAEYSFEAAAIETLANELGRICIPGHLLRFSPDHLELMQRASNGAIGNVVGASLRRDRSQHLTVNNLGIHPALLTGVHDVDLAIWFTGQRIVGVQALEHKDLEGNVDFYSAQMRHENGAVSTIQGSYLLPLSDPTAVDDEVILYGSAGMISLKISNFEIGTGISNLALVNEIEHFIDCVRTQKPSTISTPQNATHVINVVEALIDSSKGGGINVKVAPLQHASQMLDRQ
jgi:predicted dehydrogenase